MNSSIVEFAAVELAVAEVAEQSATQMFELTNLELLLIGGGQGEILLG